MLKNDVNVLIKSPAEKPFKPWMMVAETVGIPPNTRQHYISVTGDNITDNVEQVCIPADEPAGLYTVTINHKKLGPLNSVRHLVDETGSPAPQAVSIVIYSRPDYQDTVFEFPFEIVGWDRTGINEFMLSFSCVVGGIYQIERSTDLSTWTVDPGDILPNSILTTVTITSSGGADEFFRVRQIR